MADTPLQIRIGAVTKPVDLFATYCELIALCDECFTAAPKTGHALYLERLAARLEEMGYGPVSHHAAARFDAKVRGIADVQRAPQYRAEARLARVYGAEALSLPAVEKLMLLVNIDHVLAAEDLRRDPWGKGKSTDEFFDLVHAATGSAEAAEKKATERRDAMMDANVSAI